jgi:hypothetical protein
MGASSRRWLIACVYAVGIGLAVILLLQHWVHVPLVLPYLLLLACPLIHMFMHRGHGRHQQEHDRGH